MAAVTALEANPQISTTRGVVANTDAAPSTEVRAAAPESLITPNPDAASRSAVTADARRTTAGLAAPRLNPGVNRETAAPEVTLAQYTQYWDPNVASRIVDPGMQAQMAADAARISQMINSCSFLGLFCFDQAEEQATLAILNRYPPEIRGAFVERLASMGLLQEVMDRTSGYESSALNMVLRQSLSGMSSPQAAAQVLERMYPWGNESTIALAVSSLNATNSPAFADAVLMELVQRGIFMRGLSFWSPLNMYGCDSFYDILQRQSMQQYLESQRMQSMARLETILATFPPGSQAAQILRQQLAQQYSMERLNDQLSTLQCLSQPRYHDYYYRHYPDYYRDHRYFPTPRYPDGRSGTGLDPFPRGPGSGTGLPGSGSGTGLPPRSGTGLPGSGTGLPGSGTGLPPRSGTGLPGSGTGLPGSGSGIPPRSGGSGTGLGSSPAPYTPPRSSGGSGTGLGSSPAPYSPPRSSPPPYSPPPYSPPRSSGGSGTGLGSSSPSRSPSYSSPPPSYSPPPRSSGGSGTGL